MRLPRSSSAAEACAQGNRDIEQLEPMSLDIEYLRSRPQDQDNWVRCFYPLEDEVVVQDWSYILHLPPIHFVGETHDGLFHEVAVCESRLAWLIKFGFVFQYETDMVTRYNVSRPSVGEVDVHGAHAVKAKAEARFLQQAIGGILSHRGYGLDLYYLNYPCQPSLLASIEWAILERDIQASRLDVLDRFLSACLLICLHQFDNLSDTTVIELIKKDRDAWIRQFAKAQGLANDPRIRIHAVSLLRTLLMAVAGDTHPCQQTRATTHSIYDFVSLGPLLDLDLPGPVSLHMIGTPETTKALLRCKLSLGGSLDGLLSTSDTAPTAVHSPLNGTQLDTGAVYPRSTLTIIDDEDFVFVPCHSAATPRVGSPPGDWMKSPERWYESCVNHVLDPKNPEQAIMGLYTFLRHTHFLDCLDSRDFPTLQHDFDWLFGKTITTQQVVGHLASSVKRVCVHWEWSDNIQARLNSFVEAEPPLPWFDACILDQYWRHKLEDGLSHLTALERVLLELGESRAVQRYNGYSGRGISERDREQGCSDKEEGWSEF